MGNYQKWLTVADYSCCRRVPWPVQATLTRPEWRNGEAWRSSANCDSSTCTCRSCITQKSMRAIKLSAVAESAESSGKRRVNGTAPVSSTAVLATCFLTATMYMYLRLHATKAKIFDSVTKNWPAAVLDSSQWAQITVTWGIVILGRVRR